MYIQRAGLGNGTLIGNYPVGTPSFTTIDPAAPPEVLTPGSDLSTSVYNVCAAAPLTPGCPGAPDTSATGPAASPAIYNICAGAPMTPGCPGAPVAGTPSCPTGSYSWGGTCYRLSVPAPGTSSTSPSLTDWFNQNAGNIALIGGGLIFTLVLIKAVK